MSDDGRKCVVDLSSLTTDELIVELRRREEAELERAREAQLARCNEIELILDIPYVIEVLAPKHVRTSCSDADVANGFSGDDLPRCIRCALLQARGFGFWPSGFDLEIAVQVTRV